MSSGRLYALYFPEHKVETPVNWQQCENRIIVPAASDKQAKEMFSTGWKTITPFLRVVPQLKG